MTVDAVRKVEETWGGVYKGEKISDPKENIFVAGDEMPDDAEMDLSDDNVEEAEQPPNRGIHAGHHRVVCKEALLRIRHQLTIIAHVRHEIGRRESFSVIDSFLIQGCHHWPVHMEKPEIKIKRLFTPLVEKSEGLLHAGR